MQKNLGKVMRYLVVVCALVSAFVMVGCGGDGDDDGTTTTSTVSSPQSVPANATTVQAVVGQQFIIPDGSAFSPGLPSTPLTLTLNTPSTFTVTGGGTATGTVAFGSCAFTVSTSNIAGLAPGTAIQTFTLCNFVVTATTQLTVGGAPGQATVILQLGRNGVVLINASFPAGVTITVSITATGQLILNNVPTGVFVPGTTGTTGTGGTP